MAAILEVDQLQKTYADSNFGLKDISFAIPYGSIVGFIGENGAGKSTTMGSILGTLHKDSGTIRIFGKEMDAKDVHIKEDIGAVFDTVKLPGGLTVKKLERVFQQLYSNWNKETYSNLIQLFSLPKDKKISGFSRGMSMKLSVAVALSHEAKLLILDEATAGLDPGGREDMLKVLREFVKGQERSILLSSHITSDIEQIADRLIFIKSGEILLQETKEEILNHYGIVQCDPVEYQNIPSEIRLATRGNEVFFDVLVSDREKLPSSLQSKRFSIDDVTLLLMRGERV
ncbi:ABC transporter ATP-binding protein [Alkalicoccobacillus porphyridii]|uniref:ABC transporter ATP-binding protein n=1 Tax=Alkalicoccobacillus porphyridii TaxID=2597270 RepID=A0A554A2I5_9BACI|nr:ABC transporter ATP-binding protein [Alkalicoccobacillus porphyridii]TSB47900.1 ABC transporter ATP-binding protein [Alkalicoccobacillus porphyridii]